MDFSDTNSNNSYKIDNNINIYTKKSIERIKECVEKTTGNKISGIKNINNSIKQIEFKHNKGIIALNISKSNDYLVINPKLIKGNMMAYRMIIDKIRNKLK